MIAAVNVTLPTAESPGLNIGYRGENLVFIISQPKAGSTLLQRLLAGHPDIQTSAETWLMLHPVYALRTRGIKAEFNANWAATGVREFLDNYADGEETYREGIRNFAATIYGRVLEKHGKRLFLDKTPRYTMIIEELYALFPAAKYVLLLRNPLAILNSELSTYVKGDWPVLASFRPDLIDAPARIVAARALLRDAAIEVCYEDLVTDPETSMRAICRFLNVDFVPDMLDYSDTPAPVGRMNDPVGIHRHTQASTSSLDKWQSLGADPQLRSFALAYLEAIGDATIIALGYEPTELRAGIEEQTMTHSLRRIYPWKLAITPMRNWSLRQHLQHAWFVGAEKGGPIRGALAMAGALLARFGGGASRLVGRRQGPTDPAKIDVHPDNLTR